MDEENSGQFAFRCDICREAFESLITEEITRVVVGDLSNTLSVKGLVEVDIHPLTSSCWNCLGEAIERFGRGLKTRK